MERLQAHIAKNCGDSLLSATECISVRAEMVSFLEGQGHARSAVISPFQPFLLECWDAMASFTDDPGKDLPQALMTGVSTGVFQPIPPSGIWDPLPAAL